MLTEWGWDAGWTELMDAHRGGPGLEPGRVTEQDRDRWVVQLAGGPAVARLVSHLEGPQPVTGDWVTVRPGPMVDDPWTLIDVLPRRTAMSRGRAGDGAGQQVLAANVDVVWIVHPLDAEPNLRSLERYLAVAWESGATPEIVLTKADLSPDPTAAAQLVATVAIGVPIHLVRVDDPAGIATLRAGLATGSTVALLGPSGAGKSTLINELAQTSLAATGSVRDFDQKGRHTTTRRELFLLTGGALLMDTPGLRELRVWTLDEGLGGAFPEIEQLAASCRFRDCQHLAEPGCAVRAAVETGALPADRLASFRKLRAEGDYLARQSDPRARAAAVSEHKTAMKTMKHHHKYRRGDT